MTSAGPRLVSVTVFTDFFRGFLKVQFLLLVSFGRFIKYCSSIPVIKPDSYSFSAQNVFPNHCLDIQFNLVQKCGDGAREVN